MNILGTIVRFIVTAFVLLIVSWLIRGFYVGGFWSALFLAFIVAALAFVVESIFRTRITPFGRGIIGFLTSAVIIYLAQFLVSGVRITILGAILAALIIGIIDLFIPIKSPFDMGNKWSNRGKS